MKNVLSTALTVLFTTTPIFAGQADVKTTLQNLQKPGRQIVTSQNKTVDMIKAEMASQADSKKPTYKVINDAVSENKKENKLQGPADPGGGGFYRDQKTGKPVSVPEMGIIINKAYEETYKEAKYPEIYLISQAVQKEVDYIINKVSALKYYPIIPSRDTFLRADIGDVEYEKIKKDYAAVVASYKKPLDPTQFVLVAFSKNNKTYMLKSYDSIGLTDRQKAMNLIHEFFMRTVEMESKKKLSLIFQLEAHILNLLETEQPTDEQNINFLTVLTELVPAEKWALNQLKYKVKQDNIVALMIELNQKLNRPILISELVLKMSPTSVGESDVMSPMLTQKFKNLIPLFAERTAGTLVQKADVFKFYMALKAKLGDDGANKRLKAISEELTPLCVQNAELLKNSDVADDMLVYYQSSTKTFVGVTCGSNGAIGFALPITFTASK